MLRDRRDAPVADLEALALERDALAGPGLADDRERFLDQLSDRTLTARSRWIEGELSATEPTVTLRQEYPDTQRNRDRLTPAQLAREFVQEVVQRSAPPDAGATRP